MLSRPRSPRALFEALEGRVLFSRTLGIDISSYQGTITAANWTSIKNSGRDFAVTKATQGLNTNDSTYTNNMARGKAAGVVMGMYHFADPELANHTGTNEAQHFLAIAGGDFDNGNLHPVLDVETSGGATTTEGISLSAWVNEWCTYVYSHTGVKPMIYANTNYAANYLTTAVSSKWPLWVANYGTTDGGNTATSVQSGNPSIGNNWSTWKIWQYNSVSAIPGISGNVDADVLNGDSTLLSALQISGAQLTVTTPISGTTTYLASGLSSAVSYGANVYHTPGTSFTFTVKNPGATALTLGALNVPAGYTITNALSSSIAAGATDTFTVQLDTNSTTLGTKSGNISFTTNDPDASTFTIAITGALSESAPTAPTNLQIVSSTASTVSLSWADNSATESSYLLERKLGAGAYAQIASLAANTTTFVDQGASAPQPGSTYTYRVRAYDGINYSGYSNTPSVTTLATIPTSVAATDGTSDTAVHVTWAASTGATSYGIYRSTTNNSATATQIGTATGVSYDDNTVADDEVNFYWVQSLNSAAQLSGFSNSDSGFIDVAPTVLSSSFNDDVLPQKIIVQFSKNVQGSLDVTDVSVQNEDDLSMPPFSPDNWSYDSATNTATFTFTSPLRNFNYEAVIAADSVGDAAGKGTSSAVTLDFFTLAGDGTHDHVVDIADFNILATNFGKTVTRYRDGNYDYSANGVVNITDFNVLAANFGHSVPNLGERAQTTQSTKPSQAAIDVTKREGPITWDHDRLLRDSGLT